VNSLRVLVTGGAGFIGSHVADHFLADGAQVTVLDDLSTGRREQVPAGATFVHAGVASPEAARTVREGRFDVICHLAAQIDVRKSVADPMFDATQNILGTLNLVEAMRAGGHRTRFIFTSTGGATYGDLAPVPSPESVAKNPESPYGTSKLAVEYYLGYYGRVHGVEYITLRYANVYGPRQDPHGEAGVVAIFCGKLLDGQPLKVFGDGTQTRDYVYVGDVARANVLAANIAMPPAGGLDARAFNIATGRETSVLELAETLMTSAGRRQPIEHAPARPGEQKRSCLVIERGARELGWTPRVSLAEGLGETFAWFAARHAGGAR
jgi:UDP-glucose 4-epimerase